MTARASLQDYDDSNPTLEMTNTLVLDRRSLSPSSGVWETEASRVDAPRSLALPIDALDPVLSTPHASSSADDVLATWQNDAMSSVDASRRAIAAPGHSVEREARSSSIPSSSINPRSTPISPDASLSTWQQNATISPDGTLLPWRHQAPPSRWGSIALAVLFALAAVAVASFGYVRSRQPISVSVRVAHAPTPGVRHLELIDSAQTKREPAPPPPPLPRVVRKARLAAAHVAAPAPAVDVEPAAEGPSASSE
jgi:hypothetical protein